MSPRATGTSPSPPRCTGDCLDIMPRMVELGRARTGGSGIDWVEADAEDLPFGADRFNVVASVFGAMFAPRPERVATEIMRVARPGGLVAMANYAAGGFLGSMSQLVSRYAGAPPIPMPSPFSWGDPDEARRRFAGLASSIEVEPGTLTIEFDSLEREWASWERTNPPLIALSPSPSRGQFAALRARSRRWSRMLPRCLRLMLA